jgi:putative transferase (TIGR04331 family)
MIKKRQLAISLYDQYKNKKKTINLSYACNDYYLKKKIKKEYIKYHWDDINKKIRDEKKIVFFSKKISKLLKTVLDKNNFTVKEWQFFILPWVRSYVTVIWDRFYQLKKINRSYIYKINEFEFNIVRDFNNDLDFKRESNFGYFNHILNIKLIKSKYLNLRVIIKEKKNKLLNKFEEKSQHNSNKNCLSILQKIIFFFSFKFNNFFFNYIILPKYFFIKLCLSLKLIPIKHANFFKTNFFIFSLKNIELRDKLKSDLMIKNKDKKLYIFLDFIFDYLPKNYLENINLINDKLKNILNKKKIIIDSTSFEHNEIFRLFLLKAKKIGSKLIYIEHGGGLSSKNTPVNIELIKNIFDNFILWRFTKKIKKNYKILTPPYNDLKNKIIIDTDNRKHITIIFSESYRYCHDITYFPSFENMNINFEKMCNSFLKFKKNIKKNIIFRNKINTGGYVTKRFNNYFASQFQESTDKDSYYQLISNSKILVISYPQTVLSEIMTFNFPLILLCEQKQFNLDRESQEMFNLMKKNQIAFECPDKARKHIETIWDDPDAWWNKENVQAIRELYLNQFFLKKNNSLSEWKNYLKSLDFK